MKAKKAPKIVKLKKLPKPLDRKYPGNSVQQKVMKKIYLKEYKTFLADTIKQDSSGKLALKRDLNKKEANKLRKIAKTVKSNTGFVQKGKLMVLGIIVLVIVLFSVLFKDMIAEMAAEAGLQAAFGAKAEIAGMRFQIFQGRVAFGHCEVANKEAPMTNLFELGATELKIDILELLKGNVILDNIECQEIQWGTARKTSGALSGAAGAAMAKPAEQNQATSPDAIADIGAKAGDIIAAQQANLKAPAMLEAINRDYPGLNKKWQDALANSQKKTGGLEPALKAVADIKVAEIKTLVDAQKALTALDTAQKEVAEADREVRALYTDFQKDSGRVQDDRKKIDAALNADYKFLEDFAFGSPGSGSSSFSGAMIDSLARQYVGDLYGLVMQGLSYRSMLMPTGQPKPEKETPPEKKYGYFVRYPGVAFPKFWLRSLKFSIGRLSADFQRGSLADLSSDPDLTGKPTVFEYEGKTGSQNIIVTGSIDGRKAATVLLRGKAIISGFPYTIESGFEMLNIKKIAGTASIDFSFSVAADGRTTGSVDMDLSGLSITKGDNPTDLTNRAIQALNRTGRLSLGASFTYRDNQIADLAVRSNFAEILQAALDQAMGELVGDAKEKLRAEYDKLVKDSLGDYAKYGTDFDSITKGFNGSMADLTGFDKVIDRKKTEVTAQMGTLAGGSELDNLRRQFGF